MNSSITITTLALFRNELPDPDVCLYEQVLHTFDTFTMFPRLPIELRLGIWSYIFKPRRVEMSQRFWKTHYPSHKAKATPPIAMHVHKESREYTLEKYLILLQDRVDPRRTIYIHPELDTLVLPTVKIFDFEQLNCSPRCLSVICKIQRVELHHMWWNDNMTSIIGGAVNPVVESDAHHPFFKTWIRRFRDESIVRQFYDLRKLDLVMKENGRVGVLDTEKGRKDCEESFTKFMERLVKREPGYNVPEARVLF